jgi:hypothetical protein
MSNVAVIDQRAETRPNLATGGRIAAIVPQSMEDAYRLAKAVCMAGMAPKGMDTPEKAMIAIMRGLEVGLTPFQALDKIAVVNGRPTIWGDGAMALVRGSGLCEGIRETIEGEGDAAVARCVAKRRGEAEPIVGVFSVADAKKAGLWGKQGPWSQFPKRMLQMRARAFALRDGFADVLGGLYLKEEMDDVEPRRDPPGQSTAAADRVEQHSPPPRRLPPAPPPPPAAISAPALPKAPPAPPQAQEAAFDFDAFRADLQRAANLDEANAVFDRWVSPREAAMSGDELDEAQAILREVCEPFSVEE